MIQIYADTAVPSEILQYADDDLVAGYTTNPLIFKRAGVTNYEHHGRHLLSLTDKPLCLEVLADDLDEIDRQARKIASWADNAVVKIPIQTTNGTPTADLVHQLSHEGISINVTAVFTQHQSMSMIRSQPSIVSIFAGRIADTGVDPAPIVQRSRTYLPSGTKVLWASPRCVWDYYSAVRAWADIITLTPELIEKLSLERFDLDEFSRQTVEQFYIAGLTGGYSL